MYLWFRRENCVNISRASRLFHKPDCHANRLYCCHEHLSLPFANKLLSENELISIKVFKGDVKQAQASYKLPNWKRKRLSDHNIHVNNSCIFWSLFIVNCVQLQCTCSNNIFWCATAMQSKQLKKRHNYRFSVELRVLTMRPRWAQKVNKYLKSLIQRCPIELLSKNS